MQQPQAGIIRGLSASLSTFGFGPKQKSAKIESVIFSCPINKNDLEKVYKQKKFLAILIWAPDVPFLAPPEWLK